MKKQMLLASWTIFALTFSNVHAQTDSENNTFRDTIIFTPDANTKVLFIGGTLKEMMKYTRLDPLKNQLIEDVTLAQKQTSYPVAPKTTHYFVASTGKRRLKTEGEDFLEPEVNIEKERQSLDLNLPKYVFIIHDLTKNYECYIYMNDPQQLKNLNNESFDEALSSFVAKKVHKNDRFRIDLEKEHGLWKIQNSFRAQQNGIEITPVLGIELLGNEWSPVLGADFNFVFGNKYGRPALKLGWGFEAAMFSKYVTDYGYTPIGSTSFKILRNVSRRRAAPTKEKWVGLTIGSIYLPTSVEGGWGTRIGFVAQGFSVFNFSFESVYLKQLSGLTNSISDSGVFYDVKLLFPF